MTECVKIKCDDCKFVDECVDYGWEGCKKFTPAPSKPLTNEEWLRTATTEQLAKEILTIVDEEILYAWHKEYHKVDDYWNDKDAVLMWLKQPHTEKE